LQRADVEKHRDTEREEVDDGERLEEEDEGDFQAAFGVGVAGDEVAVNNDGAVVAVGNKGGNLVTNALEDVAAKLNSKAKRVICGKAIALGRLSPAKAADALFTLIRPEF
jgi:hypothetical protein